MAPAIQPLAASSARSTTATPSADFWYLSGGISQNFFGIGKTVVFGEVSEHNDGLRFVFTDVIGSKVNHWGLGVTQHIDAAAMEIFAVYKNYEGEFSRNLGTLAAPVVGKVNFQDFSTFIVGTRISF